MARGEKIYDGKAKTLFKSSEPGKIIQYFKDDATAYNAKKHEIISGKGVLNNRLSEFFMTCLLYTSPSPRDGLLSRMPSSA